MRIVWNKIERMIQQGWIHRKGFNLKDVELSFVLEQAGEEFQELRDAPDDPEEMADLFGVLIHYAIKQGWRIDFLQSLLIEKLNLRFKKPCSRDQVRRYIQHHGLLIGECVAYKREPTLTLAATLEAVKRALDLCPESPPGYVYHEIHRELKKVVKGGE